MPEKKPHCFVVSPIGRPDTETRAEADWVLRYLIQPALEADYEVKRADDFTQPDVITNLVILAIKNSSLVVVDLTDHNPNVFYELALAHMLHKPVIPLIKVDQRIPFDNQAMGTIHYSRARIELWEKAIASLKKAAAETRQPNYKVNNPVTLALGVEQLKLSGDPKEQVIAELREGLQRVSRELDVLKKAARPAASAIQAVADRLVFDSAVASATGRYDAGLDAAVYDAANRALYGAGYGRTSTSARQLFEETQRALALSQKPPR